MEPDANYINVHIGSMLLNMRNCHDWSPKSFGSALEFAYPQLKADRGVVLAAARQKGYALGYASEALQGDPEVLNLAWMALRNPLME